MVVWFCCFLCIYRELPMNQGFKQQITSMNNVLFPTFLLPHLCDPQPLELGWLWQRRLSS